jgi:malonyl-CoA O-methyltransferase
MPDNAFPRKLNSPFSASKRFSDAACDYDHHARVQKNSAQYLYKWLDQILPAEFAPKACIDVGSGTGFITDHLLKKYPNSTVHAVDLAKGMLFELKQKYPTAKLHTHQIDGEQLAVKHLQIPKQSLLISGMCAQWFSNLEEAIRNWLNVSNTVAFSVLLEGSFQAWKTAHENTGQESGLRNLPDHKDLQKTINTLLSEGIVIKTVNHSKDFLDHHPDGLSFARSLRAIGADQPKAHHKPVNLKKVISALGNACTMNYHIGFYYLERP